MQSRKLHTRYFNPRSLAGATYHHERHAHTNVISIHAPSRERHKRVGWTYDYSHFNPRSLAGATVRTSG